MRKLFVALLFLIFMGCNLTQKQAVVPVQKHISNPFLERAKQMQASRVQETQPPTVAADDVSVGQIVSPVFRCNLHSSPSLDSNATAEVGTGQHLQLISEHEDWYQVKNYSGVEGWITKTWVSKVTPSKTGEKISPGEKVFPRYDCEIHSASYFASNTVAKVKKGATLQLIDSSGDWFQVKTSDGVTGWVARTWVTDTTSAHIEKTYKKRPPILYCQNNIWEALSNEEKNQLSQKYTTVKYSGDKYGVIINAQTMNRSHGGSNAMAGLGSVVGQAAYIDNTNWGSYSALTQIGFGILGGILGSALDRPAQINYQTQYTIKLASGLTVTRKRSDISGFHTAPGACVNINTFIPADASFCACETVGSFRQRYAVDLQIAQGSDQ